MAKSLGLRELEQGNIIKVELGNGEILRGCFYGKKLYKAKTPMQREVSITGNFLVVIDPVNRVPLVLELEEYRVKNKTTIKEITATRFPKEVSAYLKKYVLALARQQREMVKELQVQAQREKEDSKLRELSSKVSTLKFEVDGDTLPVEQRVLKVFNQLEGKLQRYANVFLIQKPYGYLDDKGSSYTLHMGAGFERTKRVMDRELGIQPEFEYDGSYYPTINKNFVLEVTAVNYLRLTVTDIKTIIKDVNKLKGITVVGDKVFEACPGDYPNDGSLDFALSLKIDANVKTKDLETAMNTVATFLQKA